MRIHFGDIIKDDVFQRLTITEQEIKNTIIGPDEFKKIPLDANTQLVLFLKKFNTYYLFVDTHWSGSDCHFQSAFKLPLSFVDKLKSKEPLVILENLANRCGLTIQVGGTDKGKFITGESFPVGTNLNPQSLVKGWNPEDHAFIQNFMFRVRQVGDSTIVDIAMAYCIDVEKYLEWLHSQ